MDLTETFAANEAHDRSDTSRFSVGKHDANIADANRRHQPEGSSQPLASDFINDAHQFGRSVALGMACIEAAKRVQQMKADKSDPAESDSIPKISGLELHTRLIKLSAEVDVYRSELIALLALFDEQKGWEQSGARNCADWANVNLGIAKSSAYEFLRVGRALKKLPLIRMLFSGGELSWSKIQELTRVADVENEEKLAHVARDASVSDVVRICREFRWPQHENETIDPDTGRSVADLRAEQQFNSRSVTWQDLNDGSVQIRVRLPPEQAQTVLKSLEHCANELYESMASHEGETTNIDSSAEDDTPTAIQRRADAMVLMAERSLHHAGSDVSRADRYQVVLHVDASDLVNSAATVNPTQVIDLPSVDTPHFPSTVPWIEGVGSVGDTVARRIMCDASLVSMWWQDGEPLNVGRQSRTWPASIRRAILARDRHCQFPGCSQHRHLAIHHIDHWANGGETSVENGICLCHRHHALVHEGRCIVERNTVETNTQPGSKDFGTTIGLVSPAKKALLPTRHRFRFITPTKISSTSKAKVSGCCGDHADNKCNEAHANYRVSRPLTKKNLEKFWTSRIDQARLVNRGKFWISRIDQGRLVSWSVFSTP